MVRAMYGVQLKNRKRSMEVMFMLGLKESLDQLILEVSARWYGHVLRREDHHVLTRALHFEVEGHRKNGGVKEGVEKAG